MFFLQRFGILEGFFFLWMCFFPHTNHFPFRLTSLSITLMLKFHWHPIQNWPKRQKSADYFPDLLLIKRIVLHLSMAFCLTGYVCQLPFVSARKKNQDRKRKRKAYICQMLSCHWEETKERRARGFRAAKSSLLTSLSCSLAWQMYIVRSFKSWAKRTHLWLLDSQAPWRTAKWTKS